MSNLNHLNSILIEGIVIDDPKDNSSSMDKNCIFHISTNRHIKLEEISYNRETVIEIQVSGRAYENCMLELKKDTMCRVVGRAASKLSTAINEVSSSFTYEKLYVIADFVEIKTIPKTRKTDGIETNN